MRNSSLSSIGSTLTDENLEKEEKLKELKRKFRIVKNQLKKEMKENKALNKENSELRGKLGLDKETMFTDFSTENNSVMNEQQIEEIKQEAEKEAYKSKLPINTWCNSE
jgi:regulator of replication initiation timing